MGKINNNSKKKQQLTEIVFTSEDLVDDNNNNQSLKISPDNVLNYENYRINQYEGFEEMINLIKGKKSGWITIFDYMTTYNKDRIYSSHRIDYAKQAGIIERCGFLSLHGVGDHKKRGTIAKYRLITTPKKA